MAGYNQYRRRWSTNLPPSRSRAATVGRGVGILCGVIVLSVVLYIFGVIGADSHRRTLTDTTAATALVPPPAPLVVPTPVGPPHPFGALPTVEASANIPPELTLTYQLSGPLSGGASAADVFRITWGTPTVAQVDTLARKLGLTGPVREPKTGNYTVDGNGKLSVNARATVYDPAAPLSTTMPPPTDDRAAISNARSWLLARGLLPANIGIVDVRFGATSVDVIFHPKDLPDLFSSTLGMHVRMQTDGAITEMRQTWPMQLAPGAYNLISLDAAWSAVAQRGMPDVRLPPDTTLPPGTNAVAVIDNVSMSYAYANGLNADYLQPTYVFNGRATIPGIATPVPVHVAVPAVQNLP